MSFTIRQLSAVDAGEYKKLRLEGLKLAPVAFGSTYEEEIDHTLELIGERLNTTGDNFVLGAFSGLRLIGTLTFRRETKLKFRHRGGVYAMYVTPEWQRKGVARTLLDELISRAKGIEGLEQLHLSVVLDNTTAKGLYESRGFQANGLNRQATKHLGEYHDDVLMVLFLTGEPA